jgi:hypothetical protein
MLSGCLLPGKTGAEYRMVYHAGLLLFAWGMLFTLILLVKSLKNQEDAPSHLSAMLTGRWLFMFNASVAAEAIRKSLVFYNNSTSDPESAKHGILSLLSLG